ncbi:helix-turn-helix domain-containing protein [Sinorhizobium psoraleae]|uniref:Helix-turn-helix domain-containing protein n=1 Tax=Sinorhizobium psoraleae TaxID=520838 RepID=A0ABT4KBL0_9HYPH|nr:helix-turn-helix domain-containing protein [Sinorhizobium psoraleae]MCZ4089344.1 helix-turn-helix domain-containing protein [Sinorhizobium psoraleae]
MPAGRPTAYKPEFAEQASKLCALGATDFELADFFGVDTRTIYRWKNTHEEFCHALIAGKENADARVERALFNRAVGYTFESEKVFQFQGEVIRAPTTEHVPPDPGAAKLWLTNRKPADWRDKQEIEHGGQVALTPIINFNANKG